MKQQFGLIKELLDQLFIMIMSLLRKNFGLLRSNFVKISVSNVKLVQRFVFKVKIGQHFGFIRSEFVKSCQSFCPKVKICLKI